MRTTIFEKIEGAKREFDQASIEHGKREKELETHVRVLGERVGSKFRDYLDKTSEIPREKYILEVDSISPRILVRVNQEIGGGPPLPGFTPSHSDPLDVTEKFSDFVERFEPFDLRIVRNFCGRTEDTFYGSPDDYKSYRER
jgi:hypothetical protein